MTALVERIKGLQRKILNEKFLNNKKEYIESDDIGNENKTKWTMYTTTVYG